MNIWKVIANEGYNNAFLIDENGKQRFDKPADYMEITDSPPVRMLRIETTDKGYPDIMNYWGVNGTKIVSTRMRALLERYYGHLSIQFLPCRCVNDPDMTLWILNACEYHDVLDVEKSICDRIHNLQGKEVIRSVDKYAFRKEAFDLDIFKIYLEDRKYTTYLFVSDRFKSIMEENGITGLVLEKVYSV